MKYKIGVSWLNDQPFFEGRSTMSVGDTITKREKFGMKSSGLDKCFICKKEFEYNDMPFLALVRGHKNSFICEKCAKKVNSERTGE